MACFCEVIGFACLVALLMSFSNKAPYQLKLAIFAIGSGAIVLVCMPFMIFRPKDYRNALYVYSEFVLIVIAIIY